jgi:hypothetical protein
VPQNGSISVTFGVTIPNTATVGTYHNPGGRDLPGPDAQCGRRAHGGHGHQRECQPQHSRSYSSNTSFQSGGTTTIPGSHHSGLVAGPDTMTTWCCWPT